MIARLPAMPNAHSHAFQRALRGRGERPTADRDSFWTWREVMYGLVGSLDPDSMHAQARAAFAEMRAAGYGAVGEFHYVHHPPRMTEAVVAAARDAGIGLVLLPAAYGRGGHERFRHPTPEAFLEHVDALRADGADCGVAAHSVRACPPDWLRAVAAYADENGLVRHVHAAEQPREVDDCRAEHGCTPIELLHRTGFLGPRTSVIHGIHVCERDVELLAQSGTIVVTCPTTEGNLGDGHFPALRYRDAGVRIAIGSDSNVRIDPFEECRELETGARRQGLTRTALLGDDGDLWGRLAAAGRASLGLDDDAGSIEVDLPGVDDPADVPWAAATCGSAADVRVASRAPREQGDRPR